MGLVDFLAGLRADLEAAERQAPEPGRAGEVLRLGMEEVTVTLEVTHVATQSGEVAAKAKAKFGCSPRQKPALPEPWGENAPATKP